MLLNKHKIKNKLQKNQSDKTLIVNIYFNDILVLNHITIYFITITKIM